MSHLDDGVLAPGTQIVVQLPDGWWLGAPAALTSDTLELAVYDNYVGSSRITAQVLRESAPGKPDDRITVKLVDVHIGDRLGPAEGFVSVIPRRTVIHHFHVVPPPDRRPEGTLAVSSPTGRPGDLVPLEVSIDPSVRGLSGVSLKLRIRAQTQVPIPQFDLSRIAPGPPFVGATLAVNSATPGELDLALVVGKPVNGPAVIVSIPVRIPTEASPGTEYIAEIAAADAADFLGNPIPIKLAANKITVQVLLGDLNFDGRITIADVQLTVQGITGALQLSTVQRFAADVNRNGRPDIGDAIRILRVTVGLE
ncbi:MAG: dockerin type I repeat-containing protein [Armatimonadota bacterium]